MCNNKQLNTKTSNIQNKILSIHTLKITTFKTDFSLNILIIQHVHRMYPVDQIFFF